MPPRNNFNSHISNLEIQNSNETESEDELVESPDIWVHCRQCGLILTNYFDYNSYELEPDLFVHLFYKISPGWIIDTDTETNDEIALCVHCYNRIDTLCHNDCVALDPDKIFFTYD